MQNVVVEQREYAGRKDTEVPFGSRVSWQGAWAGTITTIAVTTILYALSLAIIALAMHPTAGSLRGASIAAWICLMATIVVGNLFGGLVASGVRGSPSMSVALLHGFITWGLTFVLSTLFGVLFLRNILLGVVAALPDALAAAAPGGPTAAEASAAGRTAIDYLIAFGWSSFGTWFVSLLFALAGAAAGLRRARRRVEREMEVERSEEIPPMTPLTPAPSA